MVTAIQAKVAAQRAADPSYQRAAANAAAKGDTAAAAHIAVLTQPTAQAQTEIFTIDKVLPQSINPQRTQVNKKMDILPGTDIDERIINAIKGIGTAGTLSKLGTAGLVAGTLYAGEQIAESVGVRGGAGFIGARPRKAVRHYNYFNMRALRRADKRIDGFIKHSRKYISSTGYKIVRR